MKIAYTEIEKRSTMTCRYDQSSAVFRERAPVVVRVGHSIKSESGPIQIEVTVRIREFGLTAINRRDRCDQSARYVDCLYKVYQGLQMVSPFEPVS